MATRSRTQWMLDRTLYPRTPRHFRLHDRLRYWGDSRGHYLFLGKLTVRWKGPDHAPMFTERVGIRRWHEIGLLGWLWKTRRRS